MPVPKRKHSKKRKNIKRKKNPRYKKLKKEISVVKTKDGKYKRPHFDEKVEVE